MNNALTLFNGISAFHLALDKSGIEVGKVYYAEIDKYANQITEHHYPDDVALGDVTKWREWDIDWASIDLVGAGFPCQAWSVAGKQLGDKDERGMLFWTTLEIIAKVLKHNPDAKFLMENVKMKKDFEEYITHHTTQALGYVEKTLINSALVSAQNRNRYYWTNFPVTQPRDKGILLKDVIEDGNNNRDKSQTILATIYKENAKSMVKRGKGGLVVGGATYGDIGIMGLEEDVMLTKMMFDRLAQECINQCKIDQEARGFGARYNAKVGDAFKKGFATAVAQKINQIMASQQAETTALIVRKHDIVEAKFGKMKTVDKATKTRATGTTMLSSIEM